MKFEILLDNASSLDNKYYINYKKLNKKIRSKSFISILEDETEKFDEYYKKKRLGFEDIQPNYYYIILNYLSIVKILDNFKEKSQSTYTKFIEKYKTNDIFLNNYYFFVDLNNASGLRNRIMRMKASSIDVVSDIHIDQWSTRYNNKYPCGEVVNKPYNFSNPLSDIVVIAGDVSDNLNLSIEMLNYISQFYDHVLFVDGNHEHVHNYPKLYPTDVINQKFKKNNNKKIVYLPRNEFIINKTAFIGVCGWWDYDNGTKINENLGYFRNWIPHFKEVDNRDFMFNVREQSIEEYDELRKKLDMYEKNEKVDNVVIVTHTIPLNFCCDNTIYDKSSTQLNTKMMELINHGYTKLSRWIFGHTHDHHEFKYKNIHFICNPRGRPEDFNRIKYQKKTIDIFSKL